MEVGSWIGRGYVQYGDPIGHGNEAPGQEVVLEYAPANLNLHLLPAWCWWRGFSVYVLYIHHIGDKGPGDYPWMHRLSRVVCDFLCD